MNDTWTHALARMAVRPLLGTGVTPNHLTTLRLLTGLLAWATLAGGPSGAACSGCCPRFWTAPTASWRASAT